MDNSTAMVSRELNEYFGTTTWKSRKHRVFDDKEQEMLSMPRFEDCQEDNACAHSSHMTLTVVELELTLNIALEIQVNRYR